MTEPYPAEETEEVASPYCETVPKLQRAWDSVSMGALQSCPRKYQLQILEGWQPKKTAPHFTFGILFHQLMELHQTLIAEGLDKEEIVLRVARRALEISEDFEGDQDGKKVRTRYTLFRCVIWYMDKFSKDDYKAYRLPGGRPATELSFRVAIPLTSPDGTPYILCGHIDKVAHTEADEVLIQDYKHTAYTLSANYFLQYSPNWQISNYIFSGSVILPEKPTGALIDAAQAAVGFNRFLRGKTERTPAQMDEWLDNTMHWIKMAERYAEQDYWPMNEQSCHTYGGCMFRGICSKDPASRLTWLKADFAKKLWNPLENRGE